MPENRHALQFLSVGQKGLPPSRANLCVLHMQKENYRLAFLSSAKIMSLENGDLKNHHSTNHQIVLLSQDCPLDPQV